MSAWSALADRGVISRDVPLAAATTYKVGGPARWYAEIDGEGLLPELGEALRLDPVPVLVLGRGSNVLIADTGFPGLVVRLGGVFLSVEMEEETIRAGGGVSLPLLARSAVAAGRLGLEFFVGIPGTVGGAVRQNAGCHGSETAEWLETARVWHLRSGKASELSSRDLGLGYRRSSVADSDLVTWARFRFRHGTRGDGEAVMREITRWRRANQPGGTLNAGSVFKNPPGDAAGRLIDVAGLKGFAVGRARVSSKHANFFVAESGATAAEVRALVMEVQRRVRATTGVRLEPEIRLVGFPEEAP